jgi:hypothetical protein
MASTDPIELKPVSFGKRAPATGVGSASSLSPQKDQGCHDAQGTSPGMESAQPLEHAARFSRGGLRRRVHETPVDRRDHEQRVRPICEQDDGSEQPPPVETGRSAAAHAAPSSAATGPITRQPSSTKAGTSPSLKRDSIWRGTFRAMTDRRLPSGQLAGIRQGLIYSAGATLRSSAGLCPRISTRIAERNGKNATANSPAVNPPVVSFKYPIR